MHHCSGVTNWFRSIVGRNQDGKSSSVSRTEQLPQLQLQLLNTADRTSALQLPNARSESSSSSSFLVPPQWKRAVVSRSAQMCQLIKWNHFICYFNTYMQTETDSLRHALHIFSPCLASFPSRDCISIIMFSLFIPVMSFFRAVQKKVALFQWLSPMQMITVSVIVSPSSYMMWG